MKTYIKRMVMHRQEFFRGTDSPFQASTPFFAHVPFCPPFKNTRTEEKEAIVQIQ